MNIGELKEMISLMNENGLSEIEIEKDGLKIRLRKGQGGRIEQAVLPAAAQAFVPPQPAVSQAAPAAGQAVPPSGAQAEIKSPMVGTFYKAPSPESPPYVKPGDGIDVGQVVCIIEAMKLMNEIKAEVKGKLVSVLVENADPVEFGQPLFLIEPHA